MLQLSPVDFDSSSLISSLAISAVGFVLFRYGRSQRRLPHVGIGLTLMLFPYAVSDTLAMLGIAFVLLAVLWGMTRYGM